MGLTGRNQKIAGTDRRLSVGYFNSLLELVQETQRLASLVAHAWEDYLEFLRCTVSPKTKRPRSARYIQDHETLAAPGGVAKLRGKGLTVQGPLYELMKYPLQELSDTVVAEWLNREVQIRPSCAAHAYRLLRAFLGWLEQSEDYQGLIDKSVCASQKVRAQLPASLSKDDCLQREQLVVWFRIVSALPNPIMSAYLQSLLLTGARREELAMLKWADIDFKWGSMSIRDKIDGVRTIPLTPYVSYLLSTLPRRNQWVFSSLNSKSGRIVEPTKTHKKALVKAGIPHVSVHGLRRSFGTLSEWVECPTGVVAQIMGHKPSAIAEKHYRRRPLDLLRMWHTKIENWMLEQAEIQWREHEMMRHGT